ncbi:hypothetical protein Tco_0275946 [Tanacetum coccineum]
MHIRASNSELVEPLAEPERTLNHRLRRRNRRVSFERRNERPEHPRLIYPPILDINHFRHFINLLENHKPMDDKPMWAVDGVGASTDGPTITIPETANEFAIKGNHLTLVKGNQFDGRIKTDPHKHIHEILSVCDMFKYGETKNEAFRLMIFPLSLTGEAKTWLDELNEGTIESWDELHMLRNCHGHNLTKGNIIKIFYHGLNETTQEALNSAAGAFAYEGSSNYDTNKIMARMDAMTMKMDAQYKEIQSRSNHSIADYNDDDTPMSHEDEAKYMQTFRRIRFYNDYRDRDLNRDNWRSSGRNDYNRNYDRSNSYDKPYDLQKQLSDFMKSQQSTNAFVKDTFMELKNKLETTTKNHQASIQNLEAKFDRLADKQSARPSGTLPSNTQPNPRGMPNYGKFLKELVSNKHKLEQISSAFLSDESLAMIQNKVPPKLRDPGKEDFDALLDEGSKILYSVEETLLEDQIFAEFDEFMAINIKESSESDFDKEEIPFEKITFDTDYKIKKSLD